MSTSPEQVASAIVSVRGVRVTYGGQRRPLHAVVDVSVDVYRGETLGVIGESGSGKSTLLQAIAGLVRPSTGTVEVDGTGGEGAISSRRTVQMVFQDPDRALNQRMPIWQSVVEPLVPDRIRIPRQLRREAIQLLELVGLGDEHADRCPAQLSGGQRQRVTIARALASGAPVVLLDEPMSGQDVSLQIGLSQLLVRLRAERGLTYVIVSHDVGAIAQLADRVGVMYAATVVELGPVEAVLERSRHPYTRTLVTAVPRMDSPEQLGSLLEGEPPDLQNPPSGCRFHPRCPFAVERCVIEAPALVDAQAGAVVHLVACHRHAEIDALWPGSIPPRRPFSPAPTAIPAVPGGPEP